jgi:hypothetical protein
LKQHRVVTHHVFFFSYLQPEPTPDQALWSDAEELVGLNSQLLGNFLQALTSITPDRFMLQTGAKNYGGHLRPSGRN